MVSVVSETLHAAFTTEFASLLRRLAMTPATLRSAKPGLVAALAVRDVGADRLEVCVWCDGGTGTNLRLRVDRVAQRGGLELTQQIALVVPWAKDPVRPGETSLDFAGQEFRPHESPERLREAIAFLAGGFAAGAPRLAAAVPELRREIEEAASSAEWRAAVDRAADAWRSRHVRSNLDARKVHARPVFVGSGLVTVDAEGERYTFRFDTTGLDRGSPMFVSGRFLTPAATRRATRLTAGATSWHFDAAGTFMRASRVDED